MECKELMAGFAARIGLGEFSSNDEGVYGVEIDGMLVSIHEVPEIRSVAIRAEIGELPVEGRDQFYAVMLRANFLGQGTGGATLSLDSEGDIVCLHRILPLSTLDVESFFSTVEEFVNTLETWRKLAADYRPELMAKETYEEPSGEWLRA